VAYSGIDPAALLVWQPTGAPANAAGPPLTREVVIFVVDPDNPRRLLEVRRPSSVNPLPLNGTVTYANVESIIRANGTQIVVLTDLLRLPDNSGAVTPLRGLARFVIEMRPTTTELTAYRQNGGAWSALRWPQGFYGANTGVRQVRARIELQLAPASASNLDVTGEQSLPFLGSAAFSYQVKR
jgi:hypothetical protein